MTIQHAEMMTEEEFLEHAGKKGMKWGVRKAKPNNSVHTSADAARYNKIGARVKKNGLDNLSNDDIAKLNKRNQLLTQYKKDNPGVIRQGAKATKSAIETIGTAKAAFGVGVTIVALAKSPKVRAGAVKVAEIIKNM